MSIVSMKKLLLVGHSADKAKLLKVLHHTGVVEVAKSSELENTIHKEDIDSKEIISDKLMRLSFAFSFLKDQTRLADKLAKEEGFKYTPEKKPFISPAPRISYEDYCNLIDKDGEAFATIAELEKISNRYSDIKNETVKLGNLIEQVGVYKSLECKLSSFTDTEHVSVIVGAVASNKLPLIEKIKNDYPNIYVYSSEGANLAPVVIISLKTERDEVMARFNELDFIRCTYNFDMSAKEKLEETQAKIDELETEKIGLLTKALEYQKYVSLYEQLYDYYLIENAKLTASDCLAFTKSTFFMEAWLPASEENSVRKAVEGVSDKFIIEFRAPLENEFYPTLVKSNKIVAPYEGITNMYSVPSTRDIDPNPFMAFFYFLMFGIMLGDAAYGIIIASVAFIMYKLKKPAPGKGGLLLVIGMGGISTFIWGMLFGGWFSWEIKTGSFLDKLTWFSPLEEPIMMLGLGLAIGFIQIMFGMGLKAVNLLRNKQVIPAIAEVFSWYSIFGGLILYVISSLTAIAFLKYAGLVFIALGLAALLILGGYPKKGAGRVIGGLAKLYNIVNFLSDILSYSRLFGLGLASAVIGMVINKIALVIIDMLPAIGGVPILGIIIAAPILIVGHLFNIGISTLGTYVHNSRLQYIEFFGKFYEGAGHQFIPLGSNTKYTYIER